MGERPPRVEVYLRSLAPTDIRDTQERIVDRLRTLDDEGRIEGVDYTVCGECVCPSLQTAETDIAKLLLRRYESFEEWADSSDRELVGFEQRDTESLLTGTSVTGIVFPRLTLAEFRSGAVTFVAPSTNGTEQTSVSDRLDVY
ncbi:HTH domain-containing protein [Salinibaculum salinum]|uniref:HTH domain-containing protein n=1 Tax=Salinibaculum salinum TaxID=3131996 RepID=UPI0030EDA591